MATSATPLISPERYLETEEAADYKSEFIEGEIYARAGGSLPQASLSARLIMVLGRGLQHRNCTVFTADVLVGVGPAGPFLYRDVTVACGAVKTIEGCGNVIANPIAMFEVLSKSTEAYDRGLKFAHYQSIASLQEYVLVSQTGDRVEVFRRVQNGQSLLTTYTGADAVVKLESIGCEFPLDEIYERAERDI